MIPVCYERRRSQPYFNDDNENGIYTLHQFTPSCICITNSSVKMILIGYPINYILFQVPLAPIFCRNQISAPQNIIIIIFLLMMSSQRLTHVSHVRRKEYLFCQLQAVNLWACQKPNNNNFEAGLLEAKLLLLLFGFQQAQKLYKIGKKQYSFVLL